MQLKKLGKLNPCPGGAEGVGDSVRDAAETAKCSHCFLSTRTGTRRHGVFDAAYSEPLQDSLNRILVTFPLEIISFMADSVARAYIFCVQLAHACMTPACSFSDIIGSYTLAAT